MGKYGGICGVLLIGSITEHNIEINYPPPPQIKVHYCRREVYVGGPSPWRDHESPQSIVGSAHIQCRPLPMR